MLSDFWHRAFKKRTPLLEQGGSHSHSRERYGLFDLLCVGVGATIGSGVFVVAGQVAHEVAGPGVIFSWLIAGLASSLSALAYAELACRWPSAGSSYTYVYATLGELPAVLAAWALSLECGVSGAAVARSWGVKISSLLSLSQGDGDAFGFNPFACLLQLAVVLLFLRGLDVGKQAINLFTCLKAFVVLLIVLCGSFSFRAENLRPLAPFGVKGVMKGATQCFFGFIGYDEVCCLAAESQRPLVDLPLSIFGTIFIAAAVYALSSLALVGMTRYDEIDSKNSFYSAFQGQGQGGVAWGVAAGELLTMPLVVMASFLPQPRILYSLARDSLCPSVLGKKDGRENLSLAIAASGAFCVLVAAFVPYTLLNNLISGGVLLSFNLTNVSLLLLRMNKSSEALSCSGPDDWPSRHVQTNKYDNYYRGSSSRSKGEMESTEAAVSMSQVPMCVLTHCESLIGLYMLLSVLVAVLMTNYTSSSDWNDTSVCINLTSMCLGTLGLVFIAICMHYSCEMVEDPAHNYTTKSPPALPSLGAIPLTQPSATPPFRTPFLPYLPLLAILLNTYLIVQLSQEELVSMLAIFLLATIGYVLTVVFNPVHHNRRDQYYPIGEVQEKPFIELKE